MKKLFLLIVIVAGTFISCKKELSCESCRDDNNPPTIANKPPVALAGIDTTIVLPADTVKLDGSASYDPDGQIINYQWSKVSGPASFTILSQTAQTTLKNLVEGVYSFELKATDTGGLSGRDTVIIIVSVAVSPPANPIENCAFGRTEVGATLLPIATLSEARTHIAVASAGNKIVYAGGRTASGASARVDIFDISSNSWSTASLSEPRSNIATAVWGGKIFFAGGLAMVHIKMGMIDIYDTQTNTWSNIQLDSTSGSGYTGIGYDGEQLFGAAANGKVVFAAAADGDYQAYIYEAISNLWVRSSDLESWDPLVSGKMSGIAATAIGDHMYFAGSSWMDNLQTGLPNWVEGKIHIFNTQTNNWASSHLQGEPRGWMAGIAVGNTNYWAGGFEVPGGFNGVPSMSSRVEMRDMSTGQSTSACLFQPNAKFSAVQKNNSIIFFTGAGQRKDKFDIYNLDSKTWSIGVLPQSIESAAIISVNNTIYVAGGKVNGTLTSQVFKLAF